LPNQPPFNFINMSQEINKPSSLTYFIAYTNTEIFGYGIVDSEQVMTTGQPFLYTTLVESEWEYKLETEFNTNPYPMVESELIVV
jgi:hypothetical protein